MGSVSTSIRVVIATILTSFGYFFTSIKPTQNIPFDLLIVAISVLFSGALTDLIVHLLQSFRVGRMVLMQSSYVEGYWYWRTTGQVSEDSPLSTPGLMYLHYVGKDLSLRGVVIRVDPKTGTNYQSSHSDIALIRDSDGRYLNYGLIPNKSNERKFIAAGRFFRSNPGSIPDTYEGSIIMEHLDSEMLQRGTKISDKVVSRYMKEYKENWISKILEAA